jgi:hypothetical protein
MEKMFVVARFGGVNHVMEWKPEEGLYFSIANCVSYDLAYNIVVALTEHEERVTYEKAVAAGVPVDKPGWVR